MTLQLSLKRELIEQRGAACEECGNVNQLLEVHHWLIHDRKKYHKFLTSDINCGLVCHTCHATVVNSQESRERFYARQLERYGNLVPRYFREAHKLGIVTEHWLMDYGIEERWKE